MASVTLMRMGNGLGQRSAYNFEHAMAHRAVLGVIGFQPGIKPPSTIVPPPWPAVKPRPPLSQYSVVPYFIEPPQGQKVGAGKWHLNHQQAHNDALQNIPSRYFWQSPVTPPPATPPPPPPAPTKITYGLRIGQNLVDTSFANERQRKWWIFQNWMEHYTMSQTVAPPPSPKPAPQWVFPFW
jgi:hypothetical protein